jgi:hypothetical protein
VTDWDHPGPRPGIDCLWVVAEEGMEIESVLFPAISRLDLPEGWMIKICLVFYS